MTISSATQALDTFFINTYNWAAGTLPGKAVGAFFNLPVVSTVSNVALQILANRWVQVAGAATATALLAKATVLDYNANKGVLHVALPAIGTVVAALLGVYALVR